MSIDVTCQCGSTYSVKEENAGRKFKCKQCGQLLQVPGGKAPAEEPRSRPKPQFDEDDEELDDQLPERRRGGRGRRRRGSRSDAGSRVTAPAICLLVLSVLHLLLHIFNAVLTLIEVAGAANQANADGAYQAGQVGGVLLMLAIGSLLIWGYVQMLNRRSYATVRATVIVSLIPICSPLICVGIPFAIWALIVILDPDVKESFES